jgi:hypothetical protein
MLLYKSSLSRIPARRKYGEAERRYGEAWRSVSAEPSSNHLVIGGSSGESLWSGAPGAAREGGSRRVTPQTSSGSAWLSGSATPSTAQSGAYNPVALKGKRVDSAHAKGVLSEWSTEFPAQTVAETLHVVFDEPTGTFECSAAAHLRASMLNTDQHMAKRQKASEVFRTIADRRGVLGMCGDVGLGPEAGLIPMTSDEKMRTTKSGTASCGPLYTAVTERTAERQSPIQRAMDEVGVSAQPDAPESKTRMHMEFLGADEEDPNAFYFQQVGVKNPNSTGWLKWRLSCFVDRVWKSEAGRPYGPSRDWGGAWGGVDAPFRNSSALNQPGNAQIVGGYWKKIPRFIMHVVDEVAARSEFSLPSPRLAIPATVVLPTAGTMPAFESTRLVPFQQHVVSRTFSGFGSSSSYRVQKKVQIGLPERGYPGWKNRLSDQARSPQRDTEGFVLRTADHDSPRATSVASIDDGLGLHGQDEESHAPSHPRSESISLDMPWDQPARLTNSSAGVRPLTVHNPLDSESAMTQARRSFPIELRGSPRNKTPNQYRKRGGPSHHRANLESWRMPHSQAHSFENLTYDRLLLNATESSKRVLPRPFPASLSSGRAAFANNALMHALPPNYLRLTTPTPH